jgi:hypothetical protein
VLALASGARFCGVMVGNTEVITNTDDRIVGQVKLQREDD